ncbi:MAG: TIM barrel protein [Candidatus Woesearchaeota archaeon]
MIHVGPGGTGGIGYEEGLAYCEDAKLRCLEIEFTHGVQMNNATAKTVGKLAETHKVFLSVHAPYFINLVSKEQEKIVASQKRIIDSCERASHFYSPIFKRKIPIVFHAGYYQDMDKSSVYDLIKDRIIEMQDIIAENDWNVLLCPELTGKATQFGDEHELLQLSREIKCGMTIDFAHALARANGDVDYESLIKKLPHSFHAHYSGINYGPKGEKNHIPVDMNAWKELVVLLKKYDKEVTVICESPDPLGDAKKMGKWV